MAHATLRKRVHEPVDAVPNGIDSENVPYTISWSELEEFQRDNEYIISGYRRVQKHWRGCIFSVFAYLHNETVNIHSHLWGAVLFLYLLTTFGTYLEPHPTTWKDSAVFAVFLASAVICLSASSFFHTSCCHSKEVSTRFHALDYSGIVILIVGSFYPCLYYGFFCQPRFQLLYIMIITALGFVAAYVVLNPEYAKPTHRGTRTAVFIALGMSAVVPVSHWVVVHGFATLRQMGFHWLCISGSLYIGGAFLYANRVPECFSPGQFDYFFASHQIFHVCVVLAALCHYASILTGLDYAYTANTCMS